MYKLLFNVAAVTGLFASAAAAQSSDMVKVRLPHSARVGSSYLPPGDYTISAIDTGTDAPVLLINSSGGGSRRMAT